MLPPDRTLPTLVRVAPPTTSPKKRGWGVMMILSSPERTSSIPDHDCRCGELSNGGRHTFSCVPERQEYGLPREETRGWREKRQPRQSRKRRETIKKGHQKIKRNEAIEAEEPGACVETRDHHNQKQVTAIPFHPTRAEAYRSNISSKMPRFSLISSALLLLTALVLLGSTARAFSVVVRHSSSGAIPALLARGGSSSLRMTVLTSNGKKIDIPEGTPLKTACEKLGVKPKYSCKR